MGSQSSVLVAYYFAAGASVGLLILLFGHWATTRMRGGLLGFAIGTLAALSLNFPLPEGVAGFSAIVPAAGVGFILGFPVGALYWKPPSKD